MGLPEPVGQHSIFRNSVEHPVRADDCGIDRPRKNQETHNHDERPEQQAQQLRPPQVHGQASNEVVFVNRDPHRVGDDHHEQQ